jgi:hypothetical protein
MEHYLWKNLCASSRSHHSIRLCHRLLAGSALTTFNKGGVNLNPKVIAHRSSATRGEMLVNTKAYRQFCHKANINDQVRTALTAFLLRLHGCWVACCCIFLRAISSQGCLACEEGGWHTCAKSDSITWQGHRHSLGDPGWSRAGLADRKPCLPSNP